MKNKIIVKTRGHKEKFDEKKLFKSIYLACKNSHLGDIRSKNIATKIVDSLKRYYRRKKIKVINSNEIFNFVTVDLKKYDKDASYMYRTHRDIN